MTRYKVTATIRCNNDTASFQDETYVTANTESEAIQKASNHFRLCLPGTRACGFKAVKL